MKCIKTFENRKNSRPFTEDETTLLNTKHSN